MDCRRDRMPGPYLPKEDEWAAVLQGRMADSQRRWHDGFVRLLWIGTRCAPAVLALSTAVYFLKTILILH